MRLSLIAEHVLGSSDLCVRLRRDGGLIALGTVARVVGGPFRGFWPPCWRFGGSRRDSSSPGAISVKNWRGSWQSPGSGFSLAELPLEDAERMLNVGPYHGDDAVTSLVLGLTLPTLGRLAPDTNLALLGEGGRSAPGVGLDRGGFITAKAEIFRGDEPEGIRTSDEDKVARAPLMVIRGSSRRP